MGNEISHTNGTQIGIQIEDDCSNQFYAEKNTYIKNRLSIYDIIWFLQHKNGTKLQNIYK